MQIIENFLSQMYQDEMENLFDGYDFPWYYYDSTYFRGTTNLNDVPLSKKMENGAIDDGITTESPQFVHTFYKDNRVISDFYTVARPVMWFLQQHTGIRMQTLHRMKINMMLQDRSYPDNHHNISHADSNIYMSDDVKVLLYYPKDSDGDTFFFKEHLKTITPETSSLTIETRVSPKKGTAVLFNASQLHASSPPKLTRNRLALNIVFS